MDPAATTTTTTEPAPVPPASEIDEWDNEDYVLPSLSVSESKHDSWDEPEITDQKPPPQSKIKEAETLYLGPSQAKLKAPSTTGNWNHTNNNTIKHKSKEAAERKYKKFAKRYA